MGLTILCNELKIKLDSRSPKIQNEADYFSSAVVVPIVKQGDELSLLFEVRSSTLSWQPGEICFPGGRIENSDAGPEHAAVRELSEELGVAPEGIEILGALDYMVSPIGVIIHPFAGYIKNRESIVPSRDEVDHVFTVPISFFLDNPPTEANMEVATKPLSDFPFHLMPPSFPQGWRRRATYPVFFYQYQNYVIWGLTARLITNFIETCRELDLFR
jgi:8-oxo-dGTP pyrophosphatase MutT (NUDIX family)